MREIDELLFDSLRKRDIGADAGDPIDLAFRVAHGESLVVYPAHRAVGANDAVFDVVFRVGQSLARKPHALPVVRMHDLQPASRPLHDVFEALAGHGLESGAEVNELSLPRIGDPEDLRNVVGELAEFLLALAQRLLCIPPVADVLHDGNEMLRIAVVVAHERRDERDPHERSVLAPELLFAEHDSRPRPKRAWPDTHGNQPRPPADSGRGVPSRRAAPRAHSRRFCRTDR